MNCYFFAMKIGEQLTTKYINVSLEFFLEDSEEIPSYADVSVHQGITEIKHPYSFRFIFTCPVS